jgi:hypothetical protein
MKILVFVGIFSKTCYNGTLQKYIDKHKDSNLPGRETSQSEYETLDLQQ